MKRFASVFGVGLPLSDRNHAKCGRTGQLHLCLHAIDPQTNRSVQRTYRRRVDTFDSDDRIKHCTSSIALEQNYQVRRIVGTAQPLLRISAETKSCTDAGG